MSLSLRQLKYFVATAELGQISQAAMQLNISQSAVTTAIRELESVLNTVLFTRHAKGVMLSEAGRRLLSYAYEILAGVDEAMLVGHWENQVKGCLRVAATYTVLGYFLPAHLRRLALLYPQLDIQLYESSREEIEQGLLQQQFDVAILLSSNVNNPQLRLEPIISSKRRLWLPSQHPLLQQADGVSLQDVAQQPYVMLTMDEAEHTTLRYWAKSPYQPNTTLRTSSVEAVRSMVANGSGVSILSDMVYRPWSLEGRRIETLTLKEDIPAMVLGLAWHKEQTMTQALTLFVDYFRQQFLMPGHAHRAALSLNN